jgi:hypothetical protein
MRLIPAIMEYVRLDPAVPVKRGSPHVENYPIILVDRLRDTTRDGTETLTDVHEEEFYFQVTVAALDPGTAERLGEAIRQKLKGKDSPRIVWDQGIPGREVTRYETDSRERYQVGAAPGARTIYYYETDMILVIQRGGLS